MVKINNYVLIKNENDYTLIVYLNPSYEEFSDELGRLQNSKTSLQELINSLIREKFSLVSISTAKVMVGTMLVTTIYVGANNHQVSASTIGQIESAFLYDEYKVQSGESLSTIAKQFSVTVSDIKTVNGLTKDTIYVGQVLKLPFYTYTVTSGDSLSLIAKKLHTTSSAIRTYNQLTTDVIKIGQKLKIPQVTDLDRNNSTTNNTIPSPASTLLVESYTVVAGDSLSVIAKRFQTTVEEVRSLNNLSTDIIKIGQVLKIPQISSGNITTELTPPIDEIKTPPKTYNNLVSYKVVTGDSLSLIAKKYDTTVEDIKIQNKLSSDVIFVGQSLSIPTNQEIQPSPSETKNTEATSYIVIPGDSLSLIAKKFGITVEELKTINKLTSNIIYVGQKLTIPSKDSTDNVPPSEPVVDTTQQVSINNVRNYTIFGVTEPNVVVDITVSDRLNSSVSSTVTSTELGEFRSNFDLSTLENGELSIIVRAKDSFGNASKERQFTIIKEASLEPPVMNVTQQINSTTASKFQITGTARQNSTVDIVISDGINPNVKASAMTDENGTFTTMVNVSTLQDSPLTITAIQTSANGIQSKAAKLTTIKDTKVPVPIILNNSNDINEANQAAFLLTGLGEPTLKTLIEISDGTGKTLTIEGEVDSNGEFRMPVDVSSLHDGDVVIKMVQIDTAGNKSPVTVKTIKKDTKPPTIFTLNELPAKYKENMSNYTVSGIAEPFVELEMSASDNNRSVSYSLITDKNGNFDIPIDFRTFNDGNIILSFRAMDTAGNIGELDTLNLLKDTKAPTEVSLAYPPYVNKENQSQFSITGTSEEEGTNVEVILSDGDTDITKTATVSNNGFNLNFDLSILKDGQLSMTISQTDKVGNKGNPIVYTIVKDSIIENLDISKSGFHLGGIENVYTIIGMAEPYAKISGHLLNSEGTELSNATTTADKSGYYSLAIHLNGVDIQDIRSGFLTQTDSVGNSSEGEAFNLFEYSVLEGDTLEIIAKRYNTTIEVLRKLNDLETDKVERNQKILLPVTASEVMNLGYLYSGNTSQYVAIVNQTSSAINTVSPSYFDINTDGTLKLSNSVDTEFINEMHRQGIRVVPFLSNHWDRNLGRMMLKNRKLAAQQIADAIEKFNLDGVNVDIENVTDLDRDNYTEFVKLLREKIPLPKEVSVAVAANPNDWTTGWHGSYDYTNLAKYADYLMIMSYDESYPGGMSGPVASAPWVEDSIQYALNKKVSAEKIVIGVAHYGRYWIEGISYGGYGITNTQVDDLVKKYNGTVVLDEASKSPKAVITIKEGDPISIIGGSVWTPGTYIIWYENEESIKQKLAFVNKYNLRGIGNWSITQERVEVWNSYASVLPLTVPVTSTVDKGSPATVPSYKTYVVKAGDNLWLIANRNNTTVSQIKELNQLTSDNIYIGQTLKLPITTTSSETASTVLEAELLIYQVASGDSLSVIAARNNTTVSKIRELNGLTSDVIYVGQTLKLPTNTKDSVVVNSQPETYIVVNGDSLSVIAKRYNTTVAKIKEENNLDKDIVYIGQKLLITTL